MTKRFTFAVIATVASVVIGVVLTCSNIWAQTASSLHIDISDLNNDFSYLNSLNNQYALNDILNHSGISIWSDTFERINKGKTKHIKKKEKEAAYKQPLAILA